VEPFFAATFLADDGFVVGFVTFFRDFLGAVLFGADFARVCTFDFFFLEPAMVAISPPGSLANHDLGHNCRQSCQHGIIDDPLAEDRGAAADVGPWASRQGPARPSFKGA
jgi:hypothetical protein